MINVGIAGIGFMGMIHYLAYQKAKGVKVVALCEQDQKRLAGDWRAIKGNFGPQGTMMDLSGIRRYTNLAEMMADKGIDVVDICLPPAGHADAAVMASKAGKHVFCEKPIALKTAEAERMVKAAKQAGKQLCIGHVLPYFPAYKFAYEAISSGKYGKLLGGQFKRMVSVPTWVANWFEPNTFGGPMLDLHIHDAHFIRLVCGMPKIVQSVGRMRGEVVELFNSQFLFDDPELMVSATSGAINQQGRAFTNAYEIYLEKATLLFDFSTLGGEPVVSIPVTVLTDDGKVKHPKLDGGDPTDSFLGEINEVVRSIRSGEPSKLLNGDLARDALILCDRQTQSVRKRKPVKV
jgi:predicted dehydrogenase